MDVIERVEREPLRLLGQRCVFRLASFLRGFGVACRDLRLAAPPLPSSDGRFSHWVRGRLGLRSRTHDWPWMIWVLATDDEGAFERFFPLWREFTADRSACPPSAPPGERRAGQPQLLRLLAAERARNEKSPCASLTDLRAMVTGYQMGVESSGQRVDLDLDDFVGWLRLHRSAPAGASWDRALIYACGDDETAFRRFYELLDEFLIDEQTRPAQEPARSPASAPAA